MVKILKASSISYYSFGTKKHGDRYIVLEQRTCPRVLRVLFVHRDNRPCAAGLQVIDETAIGSRIKSCKN